MPVSALKPCLSPGCRELVSGGRCKAHTKLNTSYANKPNDPQLNNVAWRKLRKMVLARDPVCKMCHRVPSTDADHIVPRRAGGDNDLNNLQGLCHSCHSVKTRSGQ